MALTRLDRVGDGVTTVYDVSFDLGYLRQEFVYVYQGTAQEYQNQLNYSWINNNQIMLDTPVPSGEEFFIRRVIPRDEPINDYEDGAILRESNLDDSFVQSIMILQEITDGYISPDTDFSIDSDIDMLGNAIVNCVALSGLQTTSTGDGAVSLNQVVSMLAGAGAEGVIPVTQPTQIADGAQTTFNTPVNSLRADSSFIVDFDGIKQRPTADYVCNNDGTITVKDNGTDFALQVNTEVNITLFEPNII